VDEPTDPGPERQTTAPDTCCCGCTEHQPIRIGERLAPSGAAEGVYVCPAQSPAGLRGVL